MTENIELIIFDMDGLMFDTEKISYESWQEAAKLHGYTITEEIFKETIGATLSKTKHILVSHFGDTFPVDQVIRERITVSERIVAANGVPIKHGLHELLDYLKGQPIKLAVATSASRKRALNFLECARVVEYFDCIVCGDEVTQSKPHPEIFMRTGDILKAKAENTMVLEDSEAGIEAAYRAHMLPVMVPDLLMPGIATKQKLYAQVADLSQVITLLQNKEGAIMRENHLT